MTKQRPVRWLHLSDLHLGCRGEEAWWQVHEEFEASIREKTQELGAPDLLLFTGDLTFSGQPEQFKQVDDFLQALRGWIREAAPEGTPEPLLVTVPGNHDLQRPKRAHRYQALDTYHDVDAPGCGDLDQELWEDRDATFIDPLFSAYQTWRKRRVLPDLRKRANVTVSHFPGDLSLEIDFGGFPLTVVGLNSTWQQYTGDDFECRLVIPTQQFHAALPREGKKSPLAVFKGCERSLLLMHHPPSWLAPRGRKIFDEEIYPSERFDACLYGHMHQGRSTETAIQGGKPRCFFQSPSLFGLEHYGTSEEERAIGYTWGELSLAGVVKVWPLQRAQQGGKGAFVDDLGFTRETDGGSIIGGGWERTTTVPTAPPVDLTGYLRDLIDQTNHIAISGIASSRARGAHRYPIESLYTPLSSRMGLEGPGAETGEAALLRGERSVGLAELLPRHDRLLIEGQPGAGKTTFLRLVACMLARDLVGDPCPGGGTWRSRHLGLPAEEAPRVPVLLWVSELVSLLLDEDSPRHRKDNRLWLLDLLERSSKDNDHQIPRAHWQKLLEEGGAVLLLDGLDEAADEKVRVRIFEIFRDACKKWGCPVVVTSRPLQTEPLREMGFHHATIEPFGDEEIRTFLDHWVTALHTTETGTPGRVAKRYEEALAEAIFDRPRVRRLATNPVMLTSLCVVHWNEGRRLPEGRSRVYRAVIKWLLAARSELRKEAGFTDLFAERALARLALSMMSGPEGKRAVVDLAEGAEAVMPLLERDMPDAGTEERRHRARAWLAFECLGSGIVEELPGRQIRYWHLTFQEFLAAQQLAWMGDEEEGEDAWWPHLAPHLDSAQWRETVELFPGTLLDEGGMRRPDRLLERVIGLRGETEDLATDARIAGILGRLLRPLEVLEYKASPAIQKSYEKLLDRSLAIFEVEGARQVPIEDRLTAADALGQGGDPRLERSRDNFREIPGPGGVRLGKYPVTVEEYQRFAEEGRGYTEDRFWSEEGWEAKTEKEWKEPGSWGDQLEHPSRPVVEVSWYEAEAYCRWLSEQWGTEVRLPTEAEWETAATSPEGEYPWGRAEPDSERANFDEKVGHPTPVGLYPAGNGPSGHCDLAGNVWEWCLDEVELPENKVLGWNKGDIGRALRGGGWSFSAENLRSAIRNWNPATVRYDNFGFRLAAVSASTSKS